MDIIKAIGELWKIGAVALLFCALFIFKTPIRNILSKDNWKFKRGELEIEVQKNNEIEFNNNKTNLSEEAIANNEVAATNTDEVIRLSEEEEKREIFLNFFEAYQEKDLAKIESTFIQLQDSESNSKVRIENEALYYSLKYRLGDSNSLINLINFGEKHSNSTSYIFILSILGNLYEELGEYEKAIQKYQKCFDIESEIKKKYVYFKLISKTLYKSGQHEKAFEKVYNELALYEENKEVSLFLYESLIELFTLENNNELKAFALEKTIELDSTNRFDTAYTFSLANFDQLALFHYEKLINFSPNNNSAFNNIGVLYDNLGLPVKSTKSYQRAIDLNETLASANLASKLLKAGFINEAKEILEKATQNDGCHSNVWSNLSKIKTLLEEEEKRESEILECAKNEQDFIRVFASSYFIKKVTPIIEGVWKSNTREYIIKQFENKIEILWSNPFGNYKWNGILTNNASKLEQYIEKFNISKGFKQFEKDNNSNIIYMYIEKDENTIKIMDKNGNTSNFFELTKAN